MAKQKPYWESMLERGGSGDKFKWRQQRLPSGMIVFRRTGQRDIDLASRALVIPRTGGKADYMERGASWFDWLVERNLEKKEAIQKAKKHMKEAFFYN